MNYLLTAITLFLGEEGIKSRVERKYDLNEKKPIWKENIILTKHHNYGFAHNKWSDKPERVRGISIAGMTLVAANAVNLFFSGAGRILKTGMMLLLAGGMSNAYDRLERKYVVDYFIINKGRLKKTIFNLADIMLFLGTVLTAIGVLFGKEPRAK